MIFNYTKGNNGCLVATAETVEDVHYLMNYKGNHNVRTWTPMLADLPVLHDETRELPKRRKHKKHNFTKICPACGKGFKGLAGVNIHIGRFHNRKGYLPNLPVPQPAELMI